jgi:hypothetical protein
LQLTAEILISGKDSFILKITSANVIGIKRRYSVKLMTAKVPKLPVGQMPLPAVIKATVEDELLLVDLSSRRSSQTLSDRYLVGSVVPGGSSSCQNLYFSESA